MTSRLEVTVSTRLDDLADRLDEWRELAVAAGSIFVTPEWAEAWFGVYGDDFEASIRSVTQDGRLVALVPLMTCPDQSLRFSGDGVGDIFTPLVAPDAPAGALDALFGTLRTHPGKLLVFTNVERGAAWRGAVRHDLGHVALIDRRSVLPYLDLRELDWPTFLASRSSNFRSQLNRKKRALQRSHDVRSRLTATPAELEADLDSLFGLHDQRWSSRGGSTSSSARMRAFLASVCSRALEQGWLRLWTLEIDDVPAAAWLGWRVGDRYSYYLAGFDALHGDVSPGFLLLAETVEAAIAEGASEYDFLLGDEAYKLRFTNAERQVETAILGPVWSGQILLARVERTLRRVGRMLPTRAQQRVQSSTGWLFRRRLPWHRYR